MRSSGGGGGQLIAPRGRANDRREDFFSSFGLSRLFYDDRKQRQKAGFLNPKQRRKQDNGKINDLERRDFLKTRVGARKAREEQNIHVFWLAGAIVARRRRPFLCFGHRFGRPGPAGKYFRDRFSADLVFLSASGAGRVEFSEALCREKLVLFWPAAAPSRL